MRNSSPANFFKSQLTIINPFRKAAASIAGKPGLQINFFPEGGKLLTGVSNTIVFSAVNAKMKGTTFTGKVLDNGGRTVIEFAPSLNGKGRFTLTPEPGKEYKAVVVDSLQNVYFQPLPPFGGRRDRPKCPGKSNCVYISSGKPLHGQGG